MTNVLLQPKILSSTAFLETCYKEGTAGLPKGVGTQTSNKSRLPLERVQTWAEGILIAQEVKEEI